MSANNVWIGKEHNGKFYGWDEMAETNMDDAVDGYRVLNYASAMVEADSLKSLLSKWMNEATLVTQNTAGTLVVTYQKMVYQLSL